MAKQVLQTIKQTEADAAALRQEAAQKAEALLRDTRSAGEEQLRTAEEQTKQANRQMLAEMRQKAEELGQRSRDEAEAEAARLEADSTAAVDAAAEVIIGKMMEKLKY